MIRSILKRLGVDFRMVQDRVALPLLRLAIREQGLTGLIPRLRRIVPDISQQESRPVHVDEYWELKRRGMHSFQCNLMLAALKRWRAGLSGHITVVDIGDSAGTHMQYLRALTRGEYDLDTISVNLDPRAIEKIRARGLNAMLCRAEDLELGDQDVSFFSSFEMIEHLHNPAMFFHRLATRARCGRLVFTVPYLQESRVGLHHIRRQARDSMFAEDVHVFELSPLDWTLLARHAGWRVVEERKFLLYPRRWPGLCRFGRWFCRQFDFEGFWGAVLERDLEYADRYLDWGE